jgi:hypothetical protein
MIQVPFAGQLTQQEFTRMQWLSTHWLLRYFGWIMLGCFAMTMVSGGYMVVANDPMGQGLRLLAVLLFVAFMFIAPRRAIAKHWRANALIKAPISGMADETGIEWNSAFVTGRFPWDALYKGKQAEDIVLVYTAPSSALYFPRAFFADDTAWKAFRELVSKHLVSGK